jgi:hypothetical protein
VATCGPSFRQIKANNSPEEIELTVSARWGRSHRAKSQERVVLAAILVLSMGLRVYGATFGLPLISNFYVRPDESLIVVSALQFLQSEGNPHFFVYPGLLIAVCAALFRCWLALRNTLGSAHGDLVADFAVDPSSYFLLARLVSVAAGTLTVALVCRLARHVCSRRWALVAALLFATAPLAVRDAHFGVTDTLLAWCAAGTVLMLFQYLDEPGRGSSASVFGVGLLLGLALSAKYTAFVLIPVVAFTAAARHRARDFLWASLHLTVIAGTAALAFAVLNPYVILRPGDALPEIEGILGAILGSGRPHHLSTRAVLTALLGPLRFGPGETVGLALAAVGVVHGARTRRSRAKTLVLVGAAVAFATPLFLTDRHLYRYWIPCLPFIAVLAAQGIERLADIRWPRIRAAAIAVALVAAVAPALTRSLRIDARLARADTRSLAGEWIREHVPPTVPILLFGPPEAEPQIPESESSLARRAQYVEQIYGPWSGARVALLYRFLMTRARSDGYELHRNDLSVEAPVLCLVLSHYPVRTAFAPRTIAKEPLDRYRGRVIRRARFDPLRGRAPHLSMDILDAFFLPFDGFEHVQRPGPRLEVLVVDRRRPGRRDAK